MDVAPRSAKRDQSVMASPSARRRQVARRTSSGGFSGTRRGRRRRCRPMPRRDELRRFDRFTAKAGQRAGARVIHCNSSQGADASSFAGCASASDELETDRHSGCGGVHAMPGPAAAPGARTPGSRLGGEARRASRPERQAERFRDRPIRRTIRTWHSELGRILTTGS